MSQTHAISTAEQLLAAGDLGRCELVRGELHMMSPAGWQHGNIARRVVQWLGNYVDASGLGMVFTSETGFLIEQNPDTVRAPDAGFVRAGRVPPEYSAGFFPGVPDLAFEVLSPHDTASEMADKVDQWLTAGCPLVSIADPRKHTIVNYTSDRPRRVFRAGEAYDAAPVLPDFRFAVTDLYQR
jgi:Uma2 family endonuclease